MKMEEINWDGGVMIHTGQVVEGEEVYITYLTPKTAKRECPPLLRCFEDDFPLLEVHSKSKSCTVLLAVPCTIEAAYEKVSKAKVLS